MEKLWRKWLVFYIGLVWRIFSLRKSKADSEQMRRMDYSTSTQRMGLRFTEKIRNTFRHRWLRIHR
jgi:hypothetical protein